MKINISTQECLVCRQQGIVSVDSEEWDYYRSDDKLFIQNALRSNTADEREQILTGTHGPCWDIMCPPEEDDDEDEF
jgi:hypothetical protein